MASDPSSPSSAPSPAAAPAESPRKTSVLETLKNIDIVWKVLVIAATIWGGLSTTEWYKRIEPEYLWTIGGAALAFFLLLGVPRLLDQWRDRARRRHLARSAVPPGYFVIGPRPAPEKDAPITYTLPDSAHERALRWLCAASAPVLHLSGRSGTGKSSLLTAFIVPHLQRGTGPDGLAWHILSARCTGDPLAALTAALPSVWKRPPADLHKNTLADQIRAAATYLQRETPARPLLIILDQFEALATRPAGDAAQTEIVAALNSLHATPAPGLRLLLVYRADFSGLVDTLQLAAPAIRHTDAPLRTHFELSPFSLPHAQRFIEDSRLPVTDAAALVAEAASVDSESDLVRPIVLNLLGRHLQERGRALPRLARRRQHILYAHLCAHAFKPDDVPTAHALLPALIARTRAAEGAPASPPVAHFTTAPGAPGALPAADLLRQATTTELATETSLPARRIDDYLSRLDESGLVRRLSDTPVRWEIAHDFIAKLLLNLFGVRQGLASRLARRAVLIGIPLAAAAAMVFIVPLWQRQRALTILGRQFTWNEPHQEATVLSTVRREGKGLYAQTDLDSETLWALRLLGTKSLNLGPCATLPDLTPLSTVPTLKELDLSDSLFELDFRKIPYNVTGLDLSSWTYLSDVRGLPAGLQTLDLSGCTRLTSVAGLPAGLQTLDLSECTQITDVAGLPAGLQTLDLSGCTRLTRVAGLPAGVQSLYIEGCTGLTSVAGLPAGLQLLNLLGCTELAEVGTLPPGLTEVGWYGSTKLPAAVKEDIRALVVKNGGVVYE